MDRYSRQERVHMARKTHKNGLRRRVPDDILIANLRHAARALTQPMRQTDFAIWARANGVVGPQTYIYRWERWSNALEAAGLPFDRAASTWRSDRISAHVCLRAVLRVTETIGHIPTLEEYDRHRLPADPSPSTVRKRLSDKDQDWNPVRRLCRRALDNKPVI